MQESATHVFSDMVIGGDNETIFFGTPYMRYMLFHFCVRDTCSAKSFLERVYCAHADKVGQCWRVTRRRPFAGRLEPPNTSLTLLICARYTSKTRKTYLRVRITYLPL